MRCLLRSSLRPRVWELCLDACLSMVALLGDGGAEEIHGGETAGLVVGEDASAFGAGEAGERQAHVRVIRRGREGDAGLLEVSGGGGAQAVGRGVSALADRAQMAAAEHAHRTGGRVVQACARFRGKGAAERIQLTGINRPKNHCLHSFRVFEIVRVLPLRASRNAIRTGRLPTAGWWEHFGSSFSPVEGCDALIFLLLP